MRSTMMRLVLFLPLALVTRDANVKVKPESWNDLLFPAPGK
jgi:hypothetical protein